MNMNYKFRVVIPAKQITTKKNKNGNMFFILAIPNSTREVFIPHEWLKLSSDGKTYKGTIEAERELQGRARMNISVKGEELRGIFPSKDGKELVVEE